jgi:hypothetical protein
VIAEGHGWFLRRYDRQRALEFLAFIAALAGLTIRGFDALELSKTEVLVRKYNDQTLTLADAHGIAVIQEGFVSHCWSTDWHLTLGGVPLVS